MKKVRYEWLRLGPNPGGELYEKVMIVEEIPIEVCDECLTRIANDEGMCEAHR